MADRIGIIVELTGDKEAQYSLDQLRKAVKEMNKEKVSFSLDTANIDREINKLKSDLADLRHRAASIRYEGGKGSTAALKETQMQIADIVKEIDDLQRKKTEIQIDARIDSAAISAANQEIKEMEKNAISLSDVLSGIGDIFSSLGSGMQSIGRMFGGGDAWDTVKKVITAYGTIASGQNLTAAAERFDVLRTYTQYLGMMGSTADDAQQSLDAINKSIQGLPIGLSDVAFQVRRFQMFTGDLDKATNIAVGLNKALVGGGASQNMRTTALHEVERLLTTGSLAQSRQWLSLLNGLGVSTQFLKEQMGYATMENKDFADSLAKGKIPVEEFLNGLAALADSSTVGGQKLEKALEIYKTTIESAMSNIEFAIKRGLANVMQAMDDSLISLDGGGIASHINQIRDEMNKVFLSIADWIKQNPDKLADAMDRIKGIWDRIKQFDWGGLASSVLDAMGNVVDIATKLYDMIPKGFLRDFITFGMVYATPLGRLFSFIGSIFKGLATLNLAGLPVLGRLARGGEIGRMAVSLSDIGKAFAGFTLTVAEIAEIGLVIAEYAKIVQMIADIDLGDNFGKNAEALAATLGAGTGITAILTGLMTLAGKSGVGGIVVGIGELLSAGFIMELGMLGEVIGKYAEVCQKISDLNVNWDKTVSNAKGIGQVMTELNWASAFNALLGIPGVIGAAELSAISDAVGAVMDAMDQIARANFPTPEKLRLAKTMFGNLSDAFDLGFVEGFKAFVGNLFNVYGAEKNKIESSLEILKMFDDVAEVVDSMAGKTINTEAAGANISGLVLSLAKMAQDIKDAFGGDTELASSLKWVGQESKLMTNITTMFENVGKVMKSIQDIRNTYFGQGKIEGAFQPSIMSGFDTTKKNIETFLKGVADIVNLLNPQNSPATALQGDWETSAEARMIGNIQKAFANISTMLTDLRTINKTFGKMTKGGMSVGGSIGYAIANIRTAMTQISKLFSEDLFKDLPDLGKIGMVNEKEVEGSTGGKLANLALAVESLKKVMYALRVINGDMTSGKGEAIDFSAVTGNIQTAVEGLNAVFGAIPEDMQGTVLEKVTALQSAMTHLQSAVSTLQSIQTSLSGEEGGTDTSGLTQMITNITTALSSANIDTSGIDAIATSVETLKTMLQDVANVDFTAVTGQTGTLKSGLDNVKDSAMQAKAAFEQMGGAGSSAAARISGSIQSIISSINSAINRIYALQNAINTLHGKTVNVNVNVNQHGSVSSATRGVQPHTGGYIGRNGNLLYRASGGSVFKPRGTDTVPAMLTPGEYVMNRRAVQAFGVNFMRNVNRLNISAALRSLVSRTNMPSTHSTVINNSRNYDNHATVNQNIYTNNQAFGFRRANRYVEAL